MAQREVVPDDVPLERVHLGYRSPAYGTPEFDALVLQDPVNMAYLGVKTMVAHLRGETVDERVDTGVTLITRENMNEPRMQELLRPDVDRWLN